MSAVVGRSIVLLAFAVALGVVPDAGADNTPLEAFASRVGVTVAPAGATDVDRPAAAVGGGPSVLDAFVRQVGFDITSIPPELRAEWVNSSREESMPHAMFCAIHGERTARYEWETRALQAMTLKYTRMNRLEPR